jgi:hypothetical protein
LAFPKPPLSTHFESREVVAANHSLQRAGRDMQEFSRLRQGKQSQSFKLIVHRMLSWGSESNADAIFSNAVISWFYWTTSHETDVKKYRLGQVTTAQRGDKKRPFAC